MWMFEYVLAALCGLMTTLSRNSACECACAYMSCALMLWRDTLMWMFEYVLAALCGLMTTLSHNSACECACAYMSCALLGWRDTLMWVFEYVLAALCGLMTSLSCPSDIWAQPDFTIFVQPAVTRISPLFPAFCGLMTILSCNLVCKCIFACRLFACLLFSVTIVCHQHGPFSAGSAVFTQRFKCAVPMTLDI